MSAFRLVFLPREGEPPRVWRVESGRVVDRREGLGDLHPDLPTVVAVPGESVVCRWLELPAGRDVQVAAAVAFALEDDLAQPRETVHVAIGPKVEGRRLAVLVDRGRMQDWLDEAAALPRVDAMLPDCLLPIVPEGDELVGYRLGNVWLLRGVEVAMTAEPDLVPLVAPEGALRQVEDRAQVETALARGLDRPLVDLRQGLFAPPSEGPKSGLRTVALLALALVLSVPLLGFVKAGRDMMATRAALAEIQATTGVSDGAEGAARLRARLAKAQAPARFSERASAVLSAVEKVEGMELDTLVYDEGGAFYLTARHADYSGVEVLRSQLSRAGLEVQERAAETVEGRVVSDFVVRPAQ